VSDAGRTPTVIRRALGQRMRGLRLARDLTLAEAAEGAGVSQSTMTKVELAQMVPSREIVEKLLDFYQVDGEERDLLLAMLRDGGRREWWEGSRPLLGKFAMYLGLESTATILQAYDTHLVHGLLQTADYAHAVVRATRPELLNHEVDQLVETRMRRQEILTRADPPPLTLWSIMDEAVLRRRVGGPETMHAQLQRLIAAAEQPNITLLVMPDTLGAHPGLNGPMAILQFETGARPVVYVEGQAGNLYMQKDDDLRRAAQNMNHILASAPGTEQSLALITQIAKEIKP
jgi:transcriptional regulator with XRE-family HTH domain